MSVYSEYCRLAIHKVSQVKGIPEEYRHTRAGPTARAGSSVQDDRLLCRSLTDRLCLLCVDCECAYSYYDECGPLRYNTLF